MSRDYIGEADAHAALNEKDELEKVVKEMRGDLQKVYWVMFRKGYATMNHAFLEFVGVASKFIDLCDAARKDGVDFRQANVHGDQALPMEAHDAAYLAEKLDCIFGPSLRANPDALKVFVDTIEKREKATPVVHWCNGRKSPINGSAYTACGTRWRDDLPSSITTDVDMVTCRRCIRTIRSMEKRGQLPQRRRQEQ